MLFLRDSVVALSVFAFLSMGEMPNLLAEKCSYEQQTTVRVDGFAGAGRNARFYSFDISPDGTKVVAKYGLDEDGSFSVSFALAFCLIAFFAAPVQATTRDNQHPITISDAKSLLAQVPEFKAMAERGWTYYFDLQNPGTDFNGVDFYFFEVFALQKGEENSDLVGHFAVNKWTGDVRDISADEQGEEISSPHLKEMQTQLQRKYHVSQRKLEEERNAHTATVKN